MDVKFENRVTRTTAMMLEFIGSKKKSVRVVRWVITLVYPLWMIYQGITALSEPDCSSFHWTSVIYTGILIAAVWLYPYLMVGNSIRRLRKQCGGVMPEVIVSFGDAIEVCEQDRVMRCAYEDIKEVRSLKHSYALMIGKDSGLPLARSGFTVGSFAEFKAFLRQKRPDLTIPE